MGRRREPENLLLVLGVFRDHGKEDVSVSELLESIRCASESLGWGYEFSELVPGYSGDVFEDLEELRKGGYVKRYRLSLGVPENYVSLTPVGRKRALDLLASAGEETVRTVRSCVLAAVRNYENWHRVL